MHDEENETDMIFLQPENERTRFSCHDLMNLGFFYFIIEHYWTALNEEFAYAHEMKAR